MSGNERITDTENPQSSQSYKQTAWADVFYRHGGKFAGFFVVLVLGLIALLKVPPEDVPRVLESIFASRIFSLTGWIVAGVILIFSIILVCIIWRISGGEMNRVCKLRDELQERLTGKTGRHTGGRP